MRAKGRQRTGNGEEILAGFTGFNFRYLLLALIFLLGISNNSFVTWISVEVNLPVAKFMLVRLVEKRGPTTRLRPEVAGEMRLRRVVFVSSSLREPGGVLWKFQERNESDGDFPMDVLGTDNVTFVFRVYRAGANKRGYLNKIIDQINNNFNNNNKLNKNINRNNDNAYDRHLVQGSHSTNTNKTHDNNKDNNNNNYENYYYYSHNSINYLDVNGTVRLDARTEKIQKVVLTMSRSGWLSLDQTVYLTHESTGTDYLRIPWEAFGLVESERETEPGRGFPKLIFIYDGQSTIGRFSMARNYEDNDDDDDDQDDDDDYDGDYNGVTNNVTRRRRRHRSNRQSVLIMTSDEFLLCLAESRYKEISSSVDCVNDSMMTIVIATAASSILVAVASLMSLGHGPGPENSQSLKFAVSAFVFGFAALFQLLSLILFVQSSSDFHFCFNERASLIPSLHPSSALDIRYGTGFYVAVLIFLLTNMAAVVASGRRCDDVVMAFKI